jgi:hypothetical protein
MIFCKSISMFWFSFFDRFGGTTLQEKLNFDSYGVLHKYVEKYQSKLGDPGKYITQFKGCTNRHV